MTLPAPSCRNRSAIAYPIPDVPPVIMHDLPESRAGEVYARRLGSVLGIDGLEGSWRDAAATRQRRGRRN